jgi:hypothetical protein
MKPTILYNPNNGITMPYDPSLAGMASNLVALTDAEYAKIVAGKSVQTAKKETAIPATDDVTKEEAPAAPVQRTIDTVPDAELLDYAKSFGLDFQDVYDMADENEKPQALAYIRKKASAEIRKIAAGKAKAVVNKQEK